ncbi:AAA family ATPase [Solirubrobacter taibaiensis]|nr:AAA family ATPase [Solirubrobacter taibaiensis]
MPLLERDTELATLRHVLAGAADGSGGLVVLEGPPGVGKTALVDAAHAAAQDAGLLVLKARGAELERAFGFGVVRQLFDPVLRRPELFTGVARFAAPLLGLEGEPLPEDDPFAARHALYWLTANLAWERPLALIVDDAHWADAPSLGVLAHIANRIPTIQLALVVATRPEPALEPLRARATQLTLDPLGEAAATQVVRALVPDADEAICRACHAATGGNPFPLHELARATRDGRVSPTNVAEQSPERVTREIAARLAQLPQAVTALARAAAVLGSGADLRQAAALAGTEGTRAADALIAAGVLRSAYPLEFLHPLIGAAVYAGMGPAAGAAEHGRAARLLADEGAPPERIAAQLLRCPPAGSVWAFERLVEAARSAHNAPEAVATYLQRALEEPAPPARRDEILLGLGAAEGHFDAPAAVTHLRQALRGEIAGERRLQATLLLAGVLGHTGQVVDAADVVEEQFDAIVADPALRGPIEAALANITRIDPRTRRRADAVIARMRARVEAGEEHDPAVLGTIAAELGMEGAPAAATAEIGVRAVLAERGSATTATGWSWVNAVRSLIITERYDMARAALDAAHAHAQARGAVIDVGTALTFRAELFLHLGDLENAEVDARTLREIAVGYGWPLGIAFAASALGEVLLERGELDEAARVLGDEPLPHVYANVWVLRVRGLLRRAQGDLEGAAAELGECGRRALGIDHVNPAVLPWRSALAEVQHALGRPSDLAREELERARVFGGRRCVGIALRAVGVVEDDRAVLEEAVAVLDASEAALERARAHAALGAALRRAGEAEPARERLRYAIDAAHRWGARALEDEALTELRATGARPRRRLATGKGALTPSERRIAELAAAGQQNREIAETLFVTTATVEYHLRNAYRKLGIASRTQLSGALS